jgi:hypothetical protein
MVGLVVAKMQQQKLSFVFDAKLLVLLFDFSSVMANAIILRHRRFVGQPLAAVVLLDPILAFANLSPTLSIKWCKLLLFAMLCLTLYLLLLCLLEVERWMLKSIMINLAMSVNTFFLTIFLIQLCLLHIKL